MITNSDSYNRILDKYDDLPKQQKKIADYIINRYDEVVFLSITKLATTLDVSEATVVRFAQNLGHKGFPDLKDNLVTYYREFLTPGERMKRSIEELPVDPLHYLGHASREIQLLKESIKGLENSSFTKAVEQIVNTKRIFVFGSGGNECLANHLTYRLSRFKLNVSQESVSGKLLFEKLLKINSNDLIIAYHFYKPTIDFRRLMEVATERNIPIILFTDSLIPTMVREASTILLATRGSAGTFHSQVVPMAINNALINAIASELGDKAVNALQELSDMRNKHYYNDYNDYSTNGLSD